MKVLQIEKGSISKAIIWLLINVCIPSFLYSQKESKDYNEDSLCLAYVNNFSPVYGDGEDSFVVARLPNYSLELENHINKCIRERNYSCLKYSYIVLKKLDEEHSKINNSAYLLFNDDSNPLIKLVIAHMKSKGEIIGDIFYFEAIEWIFKHRAEIRGFNKLIKKIET